MFDSESRFMEILNVVGQYAGKIITWMITFIIKAITFVFKELIGLFR